MKNGRRWWATFSVTIVFAGILGISQTFAGGSIYSRFGVGDLLYYGSSRIDAMGGAGIALIGDGFINRLNPAGIARISHTRISGGFEYSNFSSTDKFGTSNFGYGSYKGLAFGIPVAKDYGVVMLLESSPYSSVNYAVEQADNQLSQKFYGKGGLSLLSFGGSYSPSSTLTFGAKLNYVFGRIRQFVKFDFADGTFTDSELDRSDFYSGFNFTVGTIYEGMGDLLNAPSLKPLSVGMVLSTPTVLSVQQERYLTTNQTTDTTYVGSGNVDLPLAVGFGASYLISSRYYLTGDVYYQNWESANFFGKHLAEIKNSTRIALGFESLPQRETESYGKRIAYRAGIYYNSTYYNVNNTPMNELFLTTGLGLPIGPDARLNIGLHIGTRGTTSNNLQRDTIFRLTLSISASEVWFMKFENE